MKSDSNLTRRILIVDDDLNIHDIYQECLTTEGFNVDSAFDGQEGLIKIAQEVYDLVLLDIIMPKVDGFGGRPGLECPQCCS
jgi:two-component system response regulator CpxR